MKKFIGIFIFIFCFGFAIKANAQTVKHAEQDVKKEAKKVGNKTAEIASKGKSKITDKTYKDKVGPNGETIYIDAHDRYYWVDKKGHRNYVTEADLKEKPMKD